MNIRFLIAWLALGLLAAGGYAGQKFSQISIRSLSSLHFARLPSQRLFLVFLFLVSSLAACAGLGTQQEIPLTLVPITEIKEVEGTWEGLVKNVRTGKDAGRIVMVLTAHDTYGSYSFGGDTAQGHIVGAGRLTVQNGQLLSDMGQRTVVLTFCQRSNEKVVAAYAFGKDGNLYYMELTQMK